MEAHCFPHEAALVVSCSKSACKCESLSAPLILLLYIGVLTPVFFSSSGQKYHGIAFSIQMHFALVWPFAQEWIRILMFPPLRLPAVHILHIRRAICMHCTARSNVSIIRTHATSARNVKGKKDCRLPCLFPLACAVTYVCA